MLRFGPALIDEPHLRAGGRARLHGGSARVQERNTRRMFNHFIISGNQKDSCLGRGLQFIFMGVARPLQRGGSVYSPMTSAALAPAWKQVGTLHVSEVSGGKYPIIHVQIKTQRSSLMKALGRAIIQRNRKGSHKHSAHQATLLNYIKTQTTFKIHI